MGLIEVTDVRAYPRPMLPSRKEDPFVSPPAAVFAGIVAFVLAWVALRIVRYFVEVPDLYGNVGIAILGLAYFIVFFIVRARLRRYG